MKSPVNLCCPNDKTPLDLNDRVASYVCAARTCRFPIIENIPRFIPSDSYASSFGLQWKRFRKTQLDSSTGLPISKDRLTRILGGSLEILRGKLVLEAGCGAGRFTEVLLNAGANVFAVDISSAVEANRDNCSKYESYFVCQADVRHLPVSPEQFDIVVCIGVIQHTPNPEDTIVHLVSQVKPGGLLFIDHYSHNYPTNLARRLLRSLLVKRSAAFAMRFVQSMTLLLWPWHRLFFIARRLPVIRSIGGRFLLYTPVIDQQYAYPGLKPQIQLEWAILDTHDTLTDTYKHLRGPDQIRDVLQRCGMVEIESEFAGNGVEVRARKPIAAN